MTHDGLFTCVPDPDLNIRIPSACKDLLKIAGEKRIFVWF
jgi:hypothetical protein